MKIIDENPTSLSEKKEQRANTKLVNRLVRRSFGLLFRGDWSFGFNDTPVPGSSSPSLSKNKYAAGDIGYNIPLLGPLVGIFIDAGHFNEEDGSKIVVKPEYKAATTKYAHLYEQETGKAVTVTVR